MGFHRGILAAVLVVAVAAAQLVGNAAAATYVVGDSMGWNVPASPNAYATWASQHVFVAGDVLVFNFTTGFHDVARVTRAAYGSCSSNAPLALATVGPSSFTLNSTGEDYYICTFGQHCALGQRLVINVASSSASTPAMPPTPSSPGNTSSPPPMPTPPGSRVPTPPGSPMPTPPGSPMPTPPGSPLPTPPGSMTPSGSPMPAPSGSTTPSGSPMPSPPGTPMASPAPGPSSSGTMSPESAPSPTPSGSGTAPSPFAGGSPGSGAGGPSSGAGGPSSGTTGDSGPPGSAATRTTLGTNLSAFLVILSFTIGLVI